MDEREAAWDRLHEALPARWRVGLPSYDPGKRAWSVSAVGPHPGRGRMPATCTGNGDHEISALRDLDARLRGERGDRPRQLEVLRARLALAYMAGAEEESHRALGRGLSADEFKRVLGRFPSLAALRVPRVASAPIIAASTTLLSPSRRPTLPRAHARG